MANLQAYTQLVQESADKQMPVIFQSDLEHDRETLQADDAPAQFGWVLRTHGTHLIRAPKTLETWQSAMAWYAPILNNNTNGVDKHLFYWYDGQTLLPCHADEIKTNLWTITRALIERANSKQAFAEAEQYKAQCPDEPVKVYREPKRTTDNRLYYDYTWTNPRYWDIPGYAEIVDDL